MAGLYTIVCGLTLLLIGMGVDLNFWLLRDALGIISV